MNQEIAWKTSASARAQPSFQKTRVIAATINAVKNSEVSFSSNLPIGATTSVTV